MTLPKLEDWKAPWEVDLKEGDDPKEAIDLDKLKRYVHGVLGDKERTQAERDTIKTERDTLKAEKDAAARKDESDVDRLTRERDEALEKARKAGETSIETIRLQVALDKGLTKTQAKRLVGSTKEELEADADEILTEWGNPASSGDSEEEGDDTLLRKAPVGQARTAGDPRPNESALDVEKAADAYMSGRSILG